ncbi:hypothetical protein Pcinc_022506 [Petrolisthes cinctipes]|uniref:Dynein associated protein domain-containing protein n=1 Tax=Petrolisthes cinctipes TaxID=88211 RepID=A0AAE1KDK8_PETCI|nr:hypothetical protein Pcinc_022506 [Petrolisthes cinctipes]
MFGKLQQPRVYPAASPGLPRTSSLSSVSSSSPSPSPSLAKTPSQTSLKSSKSDLSKLDGSRSDLNKLNGSKSDLSKSTPRLDLSKVSSRVDCGDKSLLKRPPSVSSLDSEGGGGAGSPRGGFAPSTPSKTPGSTLFRKPVAPTPLRASTTSAFAPRTTQAKLPLGNPGRSGAQREERTSSKESSPRGDARKGSSFVETNFVETLTAQYTPGAPSSAMQTLEDKVAALQTQQEMENLHSEVHDLNEKLETLRVKRAQDKDRLKEADKMKLQLEQLVEFKSRIMDSQAQLQRDLQKARAEAREAQELREQHAEDTEELTESVEMLTLDKEMAEEKAETLQLELDQAREHIEELTLDLEILRTEMSGNEGGVGGGGGGGGGGGDGDGANSVQFKQLDQQNSRLRDTLVKMRDVSAHDKHELQQVQKELEAKKTELTEQSRAKDKLGARVTQLEQTIVDIQEQVDAALGAEEMVETLTDRNLNLEERVTELMETVADLEAINDMNDQLQENARELELELREELDMANARIREVLREFEAANEVIVDQDTTIKKFRDLVQRQQEQNIDLRRSLEHETNRPVATPSEIIDFKKMFTETKAHSKAIDMELRRLEVTQANQHVTYLTQYMPDNFMTRGGDHDAVLVLLLVARLSSKVEIVVSGVRDRHPAPETIDRPAVLRTHTVEQYTHSARLLQLLYTLQALLHQYQHVLGTCGVETFLKLGTLFPEMASHERNMDFYIDLLRKDQLDENVPTEALERTVTYFSSAYPTHLVGEGIDRSLYLSDVARALSSAAAATTTAAVTITTLVHPNDKECEVVMVCRDVEAASKEIQECVKRVRRRTPQDGSQAPLRYPIEVQDSLTSSLSHMNSASRALRHLTKAIMQLPSILSEPEGGVNGEKLKELAHQATDLIYGGEDLGPESLRLSLQRTSADLSRITATLEKGEYDFDGSVEERSPAPVTVRAQTLKQEAKDTEQVRYKLERREQDLKELKVALKQKHEELSEMTVRRDLAEKKLSTATRDSDLTIDKLQRKLDDTLMVLRRKEKEFEETMDHLQSDIESLESEKGELREKLKALNKKTLYEALSKSSSYTGTVSPSSPTTPSSVGGGGGVVVGGSGGMVKDSPMLLQQINDLRQALSHTTAASHQATAQHMLSQLATLKPIKVQKLNICGGSDGEEKRDVGKDEGEEESREGKRDLDHINELMRHTSAIQKKVNTIMTGTMVVDLSKRRPATLPATTTAAPANHLLTHRNKINTLRSQVTALQDEITRTLAVNKPGGSVNTTFSAFPSPQLTKAMGEKELVLVGQVHVPSVSSTQDQPLSEPVKVILTSEHFKDLHLRLLQ